MKIILYDILITFTQGVLSSAHENSICYFTELYFYKYILIIIFLSLYYKDLFCMWTSLCIKCVAHNLVKALFSRRVCNCSLTKIFYMSIRKNTFNLALQHTLHVWLTWLINYHHQTKRQKKFSHGRHVILQYKRI